MWYYNVCTWSQRQKTATNTNWVCDGRCDGWKGTILFTLCVKEWKKQGRLLNNNKKTSTQIHFSSMGYNIGFDSVNQTHIGISQCVVRQMWSFHMAHISYYAITIIIITIMLIGYSTFALSSIQAFNFSKLCMWNLNINDYFYTDARAHTHI